MIKTKRSFLVEVLLCGIFFTTFLGCRLSHLKEFSVISYTPNSKIVETRPNSIDIIFSEKPDLAKLINSLKVYSDANIIDGKISLEDKKAIFTPIYPLEINKRYTVIISTELEDIYGNSLLNQFSFNFIYGKDREVLKIINTIPDTSESKNIFLENPITEISFTFSKKVRPSSFIESLEISPNILGSFSFSENSAKYIFSENYNKNLEYSVSLKNSIKDFNNNTLEEDLSFTFKEKSNSENIELVSIFDETYSSEIKLIDEQNYSYNSIGRNSKIDINFNTDIKEKYNIKISPDTEFSLNKKTNNTLEIFLNSFSYTKAYLINVSVENRDYYFRVKVDREDSLPPEIKRITFSTNPNAPEEIKELTNNENISVEMINYTTENIGFLDLYVDFSSDNLPSILSSVESLNINCGNNNSSFNLFSIKLSNEETLSPEPNPIPEEFTTIIRYYFNIKNSTTNRGLINFTIKKGFCDSKGNSTEKDFSIVVTN